MDRERDRAGIPPDIAAALPEVPAKARPPVKREQLVAAAALILALTLAVWFIIFALAAARSPAQVVDAAANGAYPVQRELAQISLMAQAAGEANSGPDAQSAGGGGRSVYFFISEEQLACAVLRRGAAGYKAEYVFGRLPLTGQNKPGIWMITAMGAGAGGEFLVYGLIYDSAITKVTVEGSPAVIVDTGLYRCWYYLGKGAAALSSEAVVYS